MWQKALKNEGAKNRQTHSQSISLVEVKVRTDRTIPLCNNPV